MSTFEPQIAEISRQLDQYRERGLSMFSTSSFQTNSVVLLHLLSRLAPEIPIYFLNTGFHFPETLSFRDQLMHEWQLKIITLTSPMSRAQQRDGQGQLLFASDPDYCCQLNKVLPLEPILVMHDVWINGIRKSQSDSRRAMQVEQRAAHGALRYHPLLGWSSAMVHQYLVEFELPRHPLEPEGYFSVGCQPCTRKLDSDALYDERTGRWFGLKKSECGLHTHLGGQG